MDYNSKYFTCEQIDQRLLQGYYDDVVEKGFEGTKEEFLLKLVSNLTTTGIIDVKFEELDNLKNPSTDCGFYRVLANTGKLVIGVMQCATDFGAHTLYQRLYTNMDLSKNPDGSEHTDEKEYTWERRYYNRLGTFPEGLVGTWSDWVEVQSGNSNSWATVQFADIIEDATPEITGSVDLATPDKVYYVKSRKVFMYYKEESSSGIGQQGKYYSVFGNQDLWNNEGKARENTYFLSISGDQYAFIDDKLVLLGGNSFASKSDLQRLDDAIFPLSIAVTGGNIFEKGTSQTVTVSWTVKKGEDIITADSVTVNDEPVEGNSKVFESVTTNTTYTVKASKDGKQVQGSTSATFVNPSYIGVVSSSFSATEENIKSLTKKVKNSKAYTATGLNLNNQKVCYSYPKSFGALTSIKDGNGFENIGSYTRIEVTVNEELYYVYLLTTAATITNLKQIYA